MSDPLNNETFYTVWVRWRNEVRPFMIEHAMIETEDEAIAAITENPNAFAVYRHEADTPRRDVSEDIALRWLEQLRSKGIGRDDTLPAFIGLHLADDDIASGLRSAAA